MEYEKLIKEHADILEFRKRPYNERAYIEEFLKLAENKVKKLDKPAVGVGNIIMKFKDAPEGARFHFIGDDDDIPKDVYVKIHSHDNGLVVKWNGNIKGHQSHCCWLDEENGYDFDTEIELI